MKDLDKQIHTSKFNDSSGIKGYKSVKEYLRSINKFEPPTPPTQPHQKVTPKYSW